ncbi:MAG TPA: toxin TcdB middle/N-terminal domain-containing protein, partial [Polyangiaceae bacterium]|nr:toxin TcdB middle/N-terminal domain-containing protein [Polyangiaceae bacterium]
MGVLSVQGPERLTDALVPPVYAQEQLDTAPVASAHDDAQGTQSLYDYLSENNPTSDQGSTPGPDSTSKSEQSETGTIEGHGESKPGDEKPEAVFEAQATLPTADQTGVTGKTISIPKGEATTQGLGESFSAQLSTGIATFNVPFALPRGRGQAQPSLGLAYSSGGGNSAAGMGWNIEVPFIARQTDKGIPHYLDQTSFHQGQDRFVFNGGQELVPICTLGSDQTGGAVTCSGGLSGVPDLRSPGTTFDEAMPQWATGWQYFRPRVEGSFLRFFWSPDHRTWRVQDKSGSMMELGGAVDDPNDDNALEVNPAQPEQVYRWHLRRQFDSHGSVDAPLNLARYLYLHDGEMAYLEEIFWTPPAQGAATTSLDQYAHHVRLRYEQRTDPTFSYRSGWRITEQLRLVGVDVASKVFGAGTSSARALVRRYHLSYEPDQHTTLLSQVQVEGRCESSDLAPSVFEVEGKLGSSDCPLLPPLRFEYSHVSGFLSDGSAATSSLDGYEAFDERLLAVTDSPAYSLDESQTILVDINSDALPDVLVTAAGLFHGSHGAFFNGKGGAAGAFAESTVAVSGSADAGTIKLSNPNVVMLDVDGDATVDLLHMPMTRKYSVYSLQQESGTWLWQGRDVPAATSLAAKIDFGSDALFTRVVDVNFDGLVDVVRSTGTELQTYFALGRYPSGDGQFGLGTRTDTETADLSSDPVRMCLPWSGTSLSFDDKDTQLADMNGDGIVDIVRLRRGNIIYWPGRGNGYWGTADPNGCPENTEESETELAMGNSPNYSDLQGTSLRMDDVNGDGLADLVQVRYDAVDIWINIDGTGWTDRHIIEGTPKSPSFANQVRLTDFNGSGTPDILWGDSGSYQYIDLAGGTRPHLLVKVDNGLGKTTELEYRASTEEMLAAERDDRPWASTMPTVTHVVSRVVEHDNLTIAGRPPASYVTDYSYRDPVFEGRQREFRGFKTTTVTKQGDANSPTSATTSHFLLGECVDEVAGDDIAACALSERWRDNPREALKGLPFLVETTDENGVTLSSVHQRYDLRRLYVGLDGREVRYAFESGTDTYLYDTGPFTPASNSTQAQSGEPCDPSSSGVDCLATVRLETTLPSWNGTTLKSNAVADTFTAVQRRSTSGTAVLTQESRVDAFGNKLQQVASGRSEPLDETITSSTLPTLVAASGDSAGSGWLWRTERSFVSGNRHGDLPRQVSITQYNSSGDPVATQGQLAGTVALQRDVAGTANATPRKSDGTSSSVTVALSSTAYDDFGNP